MAVDAFDSAEERLNRIVYLLGEQIEPAGSITVDNVCDMLERYIAVSRASLERNAKLRAMVLELTKAVL